MFRSVRTCGSLQCVFNQVNVECLCLAFSLLLRAGLDPSASPNEIKCSKAMALQDYGNLQGPARDFAEHKGLGPHDLDEYGWYLLHHAVKESQDTPGMIPWSRAYCRRCPTMK